MKISDTSARAYEFACHASSCRPPTSGGTGGSKPSAGHGMGNAQGTMGKATYVRSDGTPVSKDYPGAKPIATSSTATNGRGGALPSRLKVGEKVSVYDAKGKIGTVSRSKRGYTWDAPGVGGSGGNMASAIEHLSKYGEAGRTFTSRTTLPANRTAEDKARIVADNKDFTSRQYKSAATTGHNSTLSRVGRVKPTEVSIGKDGTIKIKGKALNLGNNQVTTVIKQSWGGYRLHGQFHLHGEAKVYKTLTAAKAAIARHISRLSEAAGSV